MFFRLAFARVVRAVVVFYIELKQACVCLCTTSWTPLWGEQGFIMLERGSSNSTMSCALDKQPADGVGCTKGPHKTPTSTNVCGTCGIL